MKDKMARLRAMRGKKTTGGAVMGGSVKSMVDAIETNTAASKPSTSRRMIQHGVMGVDAVSGKSLEKKYYSTAPTGNGFVPIGSGFRPLGSN